jgi:tRNA(His) 5'-end guanylyltransferase
MSVPEDKYFVVRTDGHNFHELTKHLLKPFDPYFMGIMDTVALGVSRLTNPICAYTQSDEISFVFGPTEVAYNRRRHKFISLMASHCAVSFVHHSNLPGGFDARIIELDDWSLVCAYLTERQEDAYRNCVNAYALYGLAMHENLTTSQATAKLKGLNQTQLINLINGWLEWEKVQGREKNGSLTRKFSFTKVGFDPIHNTLVEAERNRWDLDPAPMFQALSSTDIYRYVSNDICHEEKDG